MTTTAIRPPMGPHAGARGPAFGLGLSLLVHAAVLAWLALLPAPRPADEAPAAPMQVWLAPPRPARPAPPETPAASAPAHPAAVALAPKPRHRPHARADAHAPDTPAVQNAPPASTQDVFAVPPAAQSTPATDTDAAPVVDLAAARREARLIAREESKNLVTLPARKPVVDPNGDRQVVDPIENARRSDCKTAYAGFGLLAAIPLLKDAVTGSGCKW